MRGIALLIMVGCSREPAPVPPPVGHPAIATSASPAPDAAAASAYASVNACLTVPGDAGACDAGRGADEIKASVNARLADVRKCYEDALTRQPTAGGIVSLGWRISAAGFVDCAVVYTDPIADAPMRKCIEKLFMAAEYQPGCAAAATWEFKLYPPS
jgi:hypothetical protein